MASDLGDAVLNLKTDSSEFDAGMKKAEGSAKSFGTTVGKTADDADQKMTKAGGAASGLGKAIGGVATVAGGFVLGQAITQVPALLGNMVGSASDLQESLSKVGVVFGENAGQIEKWSTGAATGMGMSQGAALAAAGQFGNLFTAMKLGQPEAAALSTKVVELGSDLASFHNINPEDALEKLRAGLVGEAEPLRALGVNMNAAMVEAKGLEMGLADQNGEMTEAAKVQARMAIIMEQTASAQGDFARTSDGVANKQRIANAQWQEAQVQIGTMLIPVMSAFTDLLSGYLIPAIAQIPTILAPVGAVLGFIADHMNILGPLFIGIGVGLVTVMIPALIAVIPLLWAKAAAWTAVAIAAAAANLPLILIVAGIALVVAGIILLVQHWDEIVAKFPALGVAAEAVKAALQSAISWITDVFVPAFVGGITTIIDFFKSNWPLIMSIVQPVLDALKAYVELWWNVLKAVFEGGFKIIQGLLDVFIGIFTGDWERVLDGVKQIVDGFWTIIKGVFSAAFDFIVSIIRAGLDLIDALFGGALDALKSMVQGAWDSITGSVQAFMSGFNDAIRAGWETVKSLFTESLGAVGDTVLGFVDTLYGYGVRLVEGLWNGIASMKGWITDKARSLGESIYGGVKSGLGKLNPLSPSEYGIEVGYYFGEGVVVGVDKATPHVTKSITGLRKDIEDSFDVKSLEDLAGGYSLGVYSKIRDIAQAAGKEAEIWSVPLNELAKMLPIANEYQEIVQRIEFEDAWNGIAEGMVKGISTGTKTTKEQFDALHQSMLTFSDYVATGFTDMETALKWAADDAADILNDAQLTGAQWAEEFRKHPEVAGLAFNELNDHMRAELGKSNELLTAWKDAALIVYEDFSIQTDGLVKPVYDAMQGIAGALDGSKADFIDYTVSVEQSMAQLASLLQNTPAFNGVGGLVTADQTGSPSGSDYVIGPGGQLIRVPKLAGGTRSAGAGMALVGERGPELVNFNGGESVATARETARLLRGFGAKDEATTQGGIGVNFYDATVIATDRDDARRAGSDVGWAVMAGLKSRGAA